MIKGLFLLLTLSIGSANPTFATVIYVTPQGNDNWTGALALPNLAKTDGPLASLDGARKAVRALKIKQSFAGTVHVQFADGEYTLDSTVLFTSQDAGTASAPIVYEAATGAHPVFLGAREIKGFEVGSDGIWRTQIQEVADGKWYFEQLFVGGHRAIRAREPNLVGDSLYDIKQSSAQLVANTTRSHFMITSITQDDLGLGKFRQTLTVPTEAGAWLQGLSTDDIKDVNLMVFHNWDNTRRHITGYDAGMKRLMTEGKAMESWNPMVAGNLFYLDNFKQALNAPGEWFLDRNGTLSYFPKPGEAINKVKFYGPKISQWLRFNGEASASQTIEYINLEGLAFKYTGWFMPPEGFEPFQAAVYTDAAIIFDGSQHIKITNCEFSHTGETPIWFKHGNQDIQMEKCFIHDFGASGIRIGETRDPTTLTDRTHHITVNNSIIRSGGLLFPCAVGIWIGKSSDNVITHNDIGDLQYTGISVGWSWGYAPTTSQGNKLEYNHVHHIGKGLMSDLGAVYTLGILTNTSVKGNVFHDIYAQTYGGWGMYDDEGTTGLSITDNLIYNTKSGGFHQHYGEGNMVRNNIFAYGTETQIQLTRPETHLSFTMENNIIYWNRGNLLSGNFVAAQTHFSKNQYWDASNRPIQFNDGLDLSAWQAAGHDSLSIISDPMFVDPEHYDFHFKAASTVSALGFKPFDYSMAGVYGEGTWIRLARGKESDAEYVPASILHSRFSGKTNASIFHNFSAQFISKKLFIQFDNEEWIENLEIQLFDMQGKLAFSKNIPFLKSGNQKIIYDPANGAFHSGLYFLRISAKDEVRKLRIPYTH